MIVRPYPALLCDIVRPYPPLLCIIVRLCRTRSCSVGQSESAERKMLRIRGVEGYPVF